jgi:hypothetical protein
MLRLSPAEGFSRLNEPTNSRMVGNPETILKVTNEAVKSWLTPSPETS